MESGGRESETGRRLWLHLSLSMEIFHTFWWKIFCRVDYVMIAALFAVIIFFRDREGEGARGKTDREGRRESENLRQIDVKTLHAFVMQQQAVSSHSVKNYPLRWARESLYWGFTAQSTTRSCRAGQLIMVLFLGRLRPSKQLTSTTRGRPRWGLTVETTIFQSCSAVSQKTGH